MNTKNVFGKRLKELRAKLKLSQTELSNITGVPQPQISKYEMEQEVPYKQNAGLLARGLNTTADYLFGKTDDPAQKKVSSIDKAGEYLNPEKPVIPVYTKEHFVRFKLSEGAENPVGPQNRMKNLRLTEKLAESEDYKTKLEEVKPEEERGVQQYIINDYDADYAVVMPDRGMEPVIPKGAICFVREANIAFGALWKAGMMSGTTLGAALLKSASLSPALMPHFLLAGMIAAPFALKIPFDALPKNPHVFLPPRFSHDHMWIRRYDKANNVITPINLAEYPDEAFKFSTPLKAIWQTLGIIRGYKMNLDLRDYRKKEG